MSLPSSSPKASLALMALVVACDTGGVAQFPSATSLPEHERRPDGIAVDLTSGPPAMRDDGRTDHAIVTLRTPLSTAAAHEAVQVFFAAIASENIAELSASLAPGAIMLDMRAKANRKRARGVTAVWRQRFRKRQYQQLSTQLIYRQGDVSTYRGDEMDALPIRVRSPQDAERTRRTDIVLCIPIATHSIKNERLLGNEIFFWLRRDGDRFVIYRIVEDTPP